MPTNQQRVKKMITFPYLMYQTVEKKAQRIGMLVPEYIRFLMVRDVIGELERIETVDSATSKRMKLSKDAYKKGDYVVYDPLKGESLRNKLQ